MDLRSVTAFAVGAVIGWGAGEIYWHRRQWLPQESSPVEEEVSGSEIAVRFKLHPDDFDVICKAQILGLKLQHLYTSGEYEVTFGGFIAEELEQTIKEIPEIFAFTRLSGEDVIPDLDEE